MDKRKATMVMEVFLILFGILFSTLAIIFVYDIVGGGYVDNQMAYASTQGLKRAIHTVCQSGGEREVTINLPQRKPMSAYGLIRVLPSMIINSVGDPKFLLYYEAFPPGQGLNWEHYLELNDRIEAVYPTTNDVVDNLPSQLSATSNSITSSLAGKTESKDIVFINILLDDRPKELKTGEPSLLLGTEGRWDDEDKTFYRFTSGYSFIGSVRQTAIKYRPCGAKSLCLKTINGIIRIEIDEKICSGIDNILIAEVDKSGNIMGKYTSNFFLASPCKAKATVKKVSCSDSSACGNAAPITYANQFVFNLYQYDSISKKLTKLKDKNNNPIDRNLCSKGIAETTEEASGVAARNTGDCILVSIKYTDMSGMECFPRRGEESAISKPFVDPLVASVQDKFVQLFVSDRTPLFVDSNIVPGTESYGFTGEGKFFWSWVSH